MSTVKRTKQQTSGNVLKTPVNDRREAQLVLPNSGEGVPAQATTSSPNGNGKRDGTKPINPNIYVRQSNGEGLKPIASETRSTIGEGLKPTTSNANRKVIGKDLKSTTPNTTDPPRSTTIPTEAIPQENDVYMRNNFFKKNGISPALEYAFLPDTRTHPDL